MPDLGTAYVQIVPSAQGIKGSISKVLNGEAESSGRSAGGKIGSSLVGAIKRVVAVAAIGKVIKDSFTAGGQLEQSFGGLETIYGNAADAAKDYAKAAASAGISANDYAEQAVSFGASLKQAFSGDVVAAAEAANTAIMDMADNSAKMGTNITSIQAAYQGFAKQNYTMLDNLKLGYGGTKTEMERLLADAEKLSGVKYDISNLGDVYDAIHVIQGELGLTGVAANEAKTTLTGSAQAMKASWQNFLAALTTGEGLSSAIESLGTNLGNFASNVIRMLKNIAKQLPTLFKGMFSSLGKDFLSFGIDMIEQLAEGLKTGIPRMISAGAQLLSDFASNMQSGDNLDRFLDAALSIIGSLAKGILQAAPLVLTAIFTLFAKLGAYIDGKIAVFAESGRTVVSNIISGMAEKGSALLSKIGELISNLITAAKAKAAEFIDKGKEFISNMIAGITAKLGEIVATITSLITEVVKAIADKMSQFLTQGKEIVAQIISGISAKINEAKAKAKEVINSIKSAFTEAISGTFNNIGSNIVSGVIGGMGSMLSAAISKAKSIIQSIKDAMKNEAEIESPSKLFAREVGQWIPAGIALGIDENLDPLNKSITGAVNVMLNDFDSAVDTGNTNTSGSSSGVNYTFNQYNSSPKPISPSEVARQSRLATRQMVLALKGV